MLSDRGWTCNCWTRRTCAVRCLFVRAAGTITLRRMRRSRLRDASILRVSRGRSLPRGAAQAPCAAAGCVAGASATPHGLRARGSIIAVCGLLGRRACRRHLGVHCSGRPQHRRRSRRGQRPPDALIFVLPGHHLRRFAHRGCFGRCWGRTRRQVTAVAIA